MRARAGFTLLELMVGVAIVGILAAIAVPSYVSYLRRGKLSEGTGALSEMQVRMESYFQNTGSYGVVPGCGITPGTYTNFTLACVSANTGQSYVFTATGVGSVAGTSYSVDSQGNKLTNGTSPCWLVTGREC